jgi:hypothetical protein
MKVLFHHLTPFTLPPDREQLQILRTRAALEQLGVEVEFLRWWDGNQTGDLIHFFGRIPFNLLELAHQKNVKVVMSESLADVSALTSRQLWWRHRAIHLSEKFLPGMSATAFAWASYRHADVCVAETGREAQLMMSLFGAPVRNLKVVAPGTDGMTSGNPPADPKSRTWLDAARELKLIYENLLTSSR